MPYKQIDLNGSKKGSPTNSPQNYYYPQQQMQISNDSGLSIQDQSASPVAGTQQKQVVDPIQKTKSQKLSNSKTGFGGQSTQSAKQLEQSPNNLSCFGGTADSGSFPNSSFNTSNTQIQKKGDQKQMSQISQSQEIDYVPNKIQKQHSYATIDDHNGSRCFSVFSKSSFCTTSSFLFGSRVFNKIQKTTPKVNMATIFKNKAYLYLDEELTNTFDDLLDKGYQIVASKKEERDIFKEQEKAMQSECAAIEKEITPLIQKSIQSNEQIANLVNIQQQYEKEIQSLQEELLNLQQSIQNRQDEISNTFDEFTNNIKQMEIQNNQIKSDININKACHRQEANSQQQIKKQKENFLNELTIQLVEQKSEYESKKLTQADRLRKMENKQKMYIGILKH